MLTIDVNEIEMPKLYRYLTGSIGPRPIGFVSTIDKKGNRNLSPFSFFNVVSIIPPVLIFSPTLSGRDVSPKNTLENVKEVDEVVINVVNHPIVQQMSLSSTAYKKGVDEFVKSGLTPIASDVVKPFRVKESPVQFECKVTKIISLGNQGGSGNLVLCEVLKIHVDEAVLDSNNMIDQLKIDLVSRMGGNWYCRANSGSMFTIPKPIASIGIGVDQIPAEIRNSKILSGNDLGILGTIDVFPSQQEIDNYPSTEGNQHEIAKCLLEKGEVINAWKVLLK